jgi:hypothetical protein
MNLGIRIKWRFEICFELFIVNNPFWKIDWKDKIRVDSKIRF